MVTHYCCYTRREEFSGLTAMNGTAKMIVIHDTIVYMMDLKVSAIAMYEDNPALLPSLLQLLNDRDTVSTKQVYTCVQVYTRIYSLPLHTTLTLTNTCEN